MKLYMIADVGLHFYFLFFRRLIDKTGWTRCFCQWFFSTHCQYWQNGRRHGEQNKVRNVQNIDVYCWYWYSMSLCSNICTLYGIFWLNSNWHSIEIGCSALLSYFIIMIQSSLTKKKFGTKRFVILSQYAVILWPNFTQKYDDEEFGHFDDFYYTYT